MFFFDFVLEIRFMIYSELLLLSEYVVFDVDNSSSSRPLCRVRNGNLYPAILLVNKQVHDEAIRLLYRNNCFQFPDIHSAQSGRDSALIAPFLCQIGPQASFIRHIYITFPTFNNYDDFLNNIATVDESFIGNLKLIRDKCSHITTLELLLRADRLNYVLNSKSAIARDTLDLLSALFTAILPLTEIIIDFRVKDDQELYNLNDLSEVIKKMRQYKWSVNVTKLPKSIWRSDDGRASFSGEDGEEACNRYNRGQSFLCNY